LDESALTFQLAELTSEEKELKRQIGTLQQQAEKAAHVQADLESTEQLLRLSNEKLDQPLDGELKRLLVRTLVAGIEMETLSENGKQKAKVTVTSCFNKQQDFAITICKDVRANSNCKIECVHHL
jgi:hypothetical protein